MFLLRYTNIYGERFFFANLGGPWEPEPTKRLVERTVTRPEDARKFDTTEEANTMMVTFDGRAATKDSKEGWEILPVPC